MEYNSEKAHEAQNEWCKIHNAPHFAPGPRMGYRCYRCNQNIYAEHGHPVAERLPRGKVRLNYSVEVNGISVERAGKGLICGCPFCCRSFDD